MALARRTPRRFNGGDEARSASALAGSVPIRQNRTLCSNQRCARPTKRNCRPTPAQERALDEVLWRCRTLSNTALEQRITAWQRCHVSVTRSQQEAELKDIRADVPEYAALHRHVLQDVLARLDKTYQAFFRRVANGEQPGFPRFQGRNRWHSFTYKEYGNGARLDNGYLVLSKIGRIAVRWSRPIEGTIKTVTVSKEADGWYVCFSCAEVPTQAPAAPVTRRALMSASRCSSSRRTASSSRTRATIGTPSASCRRRRRRVSRRKKGSNRREKAVAAVRQAAPACPPAARRLPPQDRAGPRAAVRHHRRGGDPGRQPEQTPSTAAGWRRGLPPERGRPQGGPQPSICDAGWGHFLSILAYTAAWPAREWKRSLRRIPRRSVAAAGSACQKSLSVRTHACPSCGLVLDRDENAARNIQWRGQRLRGVPALAGAMNREPVGP